MTTKTNATLAASTFWLFAALLCAAVPPAQAAVVKGDTLYVFGKSVTLPESKEPGVVSLPVAGAADRNAAFGLLEWNGTMWLYSDWIYFNSTGTRIYMASGKYPLGPPPGTYLIGAGYEPANNGWFDVGFWGFDIGRGFILARSYEDPGTKSASVAPSVPLPATLPLFAAGLGLLGWRRNRKAKAAA